MTRHYDLGKTAVPCLLQTKASRREQAWHTYFLPLKDTLIFISCSLARLGKHRILVFKYCKWFLSLEAIDLNTKPSSVYIWDISLGEAMCNGGESTELGTQQFNSILALMLPLPTWLCHWQTVSHLPVSSDSVDEEGPEMPATLH